MSKYDWSGHVLSLKQVLKGKPLYPEESNVWNNLNSQFLPCFNFVSSRQRYIDHTSWFLMAACYFTTKFSTLTLNGIYCNEYRKFTLLIVLFCNFQKNYKSSILRLPCARFTCRIFVQRSSFDVEHFNSNFLSDLSNSKCIKYDIILHNIWRAWYLPCHVTVIDYLIWKGVPARIEPWSASSVKLANTKTNLRNVFNIKFVSS